MNDRYYAKVVHVKDRFNVVINAGSVRGLKIGAKFLIVGLGETIIDPDTNEEIERLEIVRGKTEVIHLQDKIATLRSIEYELTQDIKEITKVKNVAPSSHRAFGSIGLFGNTPEETITESIKPGTRELKELNGVQIGDYAIAL
jgi:hypothetical protein